ncbi:MAG: NADH dehydrogenase (quinone) subunit D [Candidatus Wallbacteria bacterium]|nr:NADH dehydrogenase (quinone) subunit D [Candidatus Wallbacteria bacterium]
MDQDPLGNRLTVNIGPSHPVTHGTLRFLCELDGEVIVSCLPEIGYLHRAFEKSSEKGSYTEVIPYTDRLNYCSAMMNNVGYCMAVEKFFDLTIPERGIYVRMIVSEMSRIMDHLVCIGTNAVDLGALTNFWYFFQAREELYDLIESLCGARLTTTYTRIGGVMADLPEGWAGRLEALLAKLYKVLEDVDGLLTKNRIFIDRTRGVGGISAEDAIGYGFTGPCLRACGVAHDLRKANPYMFYDRFQFDVPTGERGDVYDRYLVRMAEMRQSLRLLEQLLATLPGGPVNADNPLVVLPPKEKVYGSIEGLISQFELIIKGVQPPAGEVYVATEAANGELGFYIVSDGTGRPYRVRVRPPCFPLMSSMPHLVKGQMLADMVATLGSINIIAGELDR